MAASLAHPRHAGTTMPDPAGVAAVRAYYDQRLEDGAGMPGAGLIWFMTADHLSPAMSDEDTYALDSRRWREAIQQRVEGLAREVGIAKGWRVLDLGTGIGGPGRDIMAATGSEVYGVNLSEVQLRTLLHLSRRHGIPYRHVVQADMRRLPWRSGSFDAAVSVNSLYHVPDPGTVLAEIRRVLVPGGRFGIDDWFLTRATPVSTSQRLRRVWSAPEDGFHALDAILSLAASAGLVVEKVIDHSEEAGRFLSEERFGVTYDRQVRPVLVKTFPSLYWYPGWRPEHAKLAAEQLRADILHMGALYRNGTAAYAQIIGSSPGGT